MRPSTSTRPHPHVNIPQGALPPIIVSPARGSTPYQFESNGETHGPSNSYNHFYAFPQASSHSTSHPNSANLNVPTRPRATSSYEPDSAVIAFPEPQLHRSSSQLINGHEPRPTHRTSKSEVVPLEPPSPQSSVTSFGTSSIESDESGLQDDFATLSLDSEEGLRRFQAGKIPERDEQWYKFVPPEARDALGKHEVERQSAIFEVFTSERDYVNDLELIRDVFLDPLRNAQPEVIPNERIKGFISEVFWNLGSIRAHHQRMLGSLFARQREQHPLISSLADIILDNALLFMSEYESYIKHSPLALERHRKELKRNPHYESFIQQCSQDPRIRKRDIKTFLSRPVTRLPRLKLLLERIQNVTDLEHPDAETLPLVLTILSDFIKSTEPGILAAESKVKFWGVCESLVYSRGEIIDMDLYDDSRTLIYSSPLARKSRSENWNGWSELLVVLFDNYLLLLKEEKRSNGAIRRLVVSRPVPLEYLRLGSFNDPPDTRRERSEDGGILQSLSYARQDVYPFTIYHAAAKLKRRYTLWAPTVSVRKKWHDALVDAIGVRKVRQDSNMWFAQQQVNDGVFRVASPRVPYNSTAKLTGQVTFAAPFSSGGKNFLSVGCASGIYVGVRGQNSFRKVLTFSNPTSMVVLQDFNKFVVHYESALVSYSLDVLARVALEQAPAQSLDASKERVAPSDANVIFFKAGQYADRTLIFYASKSLFQVTLHAMEVVGVSETNATPRRSHAGPLGFRSFGSPLNIPRDAHDIIFLMKTVAVCSSVGLMTVNPTKFVQLSYNYHFNFSILTAYVYSLSADASTVVPDFSQTNSNLPMHSLKTRCDDAKVLGIVRTNNSELLVIYDGLGCYVDKYGRPCRSSGYIRWETKAKSYAHRGGHLLLFSSEFIEVRSISTGRLEQVIEGSAVRLLHSGITEKDMLLVGMKGSQDDKNGTSEKIVELLQTSEITAPTPPMAIDAIWDEWDM
ncbi:hypothetical protein EW146_g670 [Bondarzewia mesenterica]|uniref:DH domain-containing protein n=1 Tax=Bondarzewia mesenterica TaxID=1095465 RepID=A0A4S4M698_9AGAM|nr:hypothetical protein EW146_g670 [Bondarzewia mesenterica]